MAHFNSNPGPHHWLAVKHLLCYVKGTIDYKLVYGSGDNNDELFTTYTGGYVTCIGGCAVGWRSWLQPIVTLSTTEAEFVAAVEAGKEIKWMRNILQEFGYPVKQPSTLFIDNQSALTVSKNPEHHGRMKHLDLRYFWLRDEVESGTIAPVCYNIVVQHVT